jgi:hypothetical protein
MRIFKVRAAKTKYNYYTINSDIEGADVIFDGEQIGVIENGKFVYKIEQKTDTGSHTVKVENGTLVNKDTIYYLSAKIALTIPASGGRYNFNTDNINSTKVIYTPSYPAQTTIEANTAVDLNTIQTPANSNVGFTPTYYDIAKNDTLTTKDHNIELTQDESGKKVTVTIKQEANVNVNYTVNSDIEGAEVQFSINNSDFTPVGNIIDGTLNFNILKTDTASTVYIKLVGGTLPETKETYIFEAEDIDISAEAWSGKPTITSSKGMTTYSMPAIKTLNNNVTTTTINAVSNQQDGVAVGYTPNDTISIEENKTTNAKQYTYDYTQNESGKTLRITIRQAAGVQYQYTVNYNVPNSTVLADGENVGTISNGSCTFVKWNSGAKSSYAISFTGGQMPAPPTTTYAFSVSPTSLSFSDKGETKSVTVTSIKTVYTNVHNTGTVRKGQAVTLRYKTNNQVTNPTYSRSNSGTGLSGTGTSIGFAANPNKVQRSGSVTFTQAESNKTATVSCTQAAKVAYSYTINSNCEGGTVYFNNVNKGTISGGRLAFEDDAASGTVRISGGVPSDSSIYVTSETRTNGLDSDSDTTTDSETVFEWNNWTWDYLESTGMDFIQAGETNVWPLYSHVKSRTGTRYRYRDIYESRNQYRDTTYSAPSSKTVYGDSSAVTMNYTSSTSTRWTSWSFDYYGSWGSWGSWSYGSYSYSRKNVTITESLSWMSVSKTTYGSSGTTGYDISFTATENNGSNRSGYITFSNGINSYRVLVTQIGVEYVFKFSGSLGTHSANGTTNRNNLTECGGKCRLISYKKVGNTYTLLGASFASGGQPNQVYDYWAYGDAGSTTNTGWDFAISCKQSPYMSSSSNSRSYTVTMKQAESGKTASITIRQSDYVLNIGGKTTDTYNLDWNSYSKNTNTGYKYPACQSGGDKANWPTWIADSQASWLGLNNNLITFTGKNGDFLYCKALSDNRSFSSRTGRFTIGIQGKTAQLSPGTYSFNVVQAAAPNEFYVKTSSGTGIFAFSRNNVTSLPHPSIITFPIATTPLKISSLYISNTGLGAPFTSYGTQTFKVWKVSGNTATYYKTISVAPGGTVTI